PRLAHDDGRRLDPRRSPAGGADMLAVLISAVGQARRLRQSPLERSGQEPPLAPMLNWQRVESEPPNDVRPSSKSLPISGSPSAPVTDRPSKFRCTTAGRNGGARCRALLISLP